MCSKVILFLILAVSLGMMPKSGTVVLDHEEKSKRTRKAPSQHWELKILPDAHSHTFLQASW